MFEIITRLFSDENGSEYTGYGIRCGEYEFNNVTDNSESIQELVYRLEKGLFAPEHLEDVIDDWIAD